MQAPRWVFPFLLAAIVVVLAYQFSCLYTTPRPDCDRWHGDETWLMREFATQVTTGVMRYPEAVGATIGERNTFPLSSMWLNAVVYGVPVATMPPSVSIIDSGRTVTAFLSIVLLVTMYWVARELGARKEIAIFGILALVTTRTFLFASHSARYDIWVGLGVLLVWFAAIRFPQWKVIKWKHWLWLGLALPGLLVWNIHVLRIAGILWLFAFIAGGGLRKWQNIFWTALGVIVGIGILAVLYLIFSGPLVLSEATSHSQFDQVMKNIPMLHPFAPQLQWANLVLRWQQWMREAPLLLIVMVIGVLVAVARGLKYRAAMRSNIVLATILVLAAWCLTMRPLPYYDLHILPVLVVA